MININGIIRRREKVELDKTAEAAVERLHGYEIIGNAIVERITYLSDGLNINGYIARPKKNGVYPVLIWNRGGSEEHGALDDLRAFLVLAATAVWGYVVLATQYRGNMGSEGVEDWGGDDLNDSLNMIEAARNLPECDTERIAVEGVSRGGMTTCRALLKYDKFRCAIIHAGIADVVSLIKVKPIFRELVEKRYEHLSEDRMVQELKKISAVYFADKLPRNIPVLLMHGTDDTVVPIDQSKTLAARLEEYNIPNKLVIIEGGTHVALKDGTYKEIDRYRREWLRKYL
jgi:dipeptidyl aminopeptidase/acylaminoacyl peptidase